VIACPHCGFENAAGRKFCGSCGSPLAATCASCGAANDPGMRFCGECGSPLVEEAAAPAAAAPGKAAERRVVSVLFADLVGFTPLSESRDPEEVRELLSRYFDTCRRLIGIYGGTVEKFIGDAVMAVWGTPTAQEDDAERAVRTALDLVTAVAALGEVVGAPELTLRAGVLTGEAAINLAAEGEGMVAGDLVNTAARVQATAAPGTVLVGDATRRATAAAIAYEPAGEHELKGKTEPISLFRALRVTAARGGARSSSELEPPFVGRARELRLVKEHFHGSAEERKAHLVSVVGIAGIGKSRLAWEFEKYLDGVAGEVLWHRGRCLAYGDGVAYWALAEMVRMRALIAEEDGPDDALAKLRAMLEQHVDDPAERTWLEPRLGHLLGLAEHASGDRQDLFSAWRLFFERLAERSPITLVFEDLQWADSALLDFVDHLLEWTHAQPIFVLALARPELAERRPSFGGAGRNATTLSLEPLAAAAMEELLDGFVPGLPDDLRARILDRAEGVPLYAVETVRMLLDRGLLARDDNTYRPTGPIEALEVPETLHALVAARLDGLAPEERRILQDAAVLGKSFTKGGLAALSGLSEAELEPLLASVVRKEVLSVQADPRSPERGQYAFLQDLLRQIAYETLARADRKARHLAAAEYLTNSAGQAEQETVEVVAAHYLDAYEAAPDADDAEILRAKAAEQLTRAGERAASLAATEEAQRYFEKAAALADDDLMRARLLEQAGIAAFDGASFPASVELFDSAIDFYNATGSTHAGARVTARLGLAMWRRGDLRGGADRLVQALDVLADDEPDVEIAGLVEMLARLAFFLGDHGLARTRVERALEIAEALPAPEVLADALNTKSLLLASNGRYEEATALLQRAIALAREHEPGQTLLRAINNHCADLSLRARYSELYAAAREGEELARRLGMREHEQNFLNWAFLAAWTLGDWDSCDAFVERYTAGGTYQALFRAHGIIFLAAPRGRADDCRRAFEEVEPLKESEDAQVSSGVLELEGLVLHAEGRFAEAAAALRAAQETEAPVHPRLDAQSWGMELEAMADAGDAAGLEERLAVRDALAAVDRTPYVEATHARFHGRLLALRGDSAGAAKALESAARQFAAQSLRFVEAATLVELAETSNTAVPAEARETLERLRAQPWLARVDALERAVTV
jgi:predicted ATPase/class 3 adenylate cyclase